LRRTSLRIAETSAARQVGALAGPAHVADMLVGRPNALIVGSAYPAVLSAVVEVLEAPALRVETTADLRGVELAAASSQVLSLAAGLADGLELGAAFHAIILSRGLLEVARVGAEVGASLETFAGLAGLGRLLDAVRRGEPNYALGCTLGRANARVAVQRAEHPEALGVEVAATLQLAAASRGMSLPVVEAVADVMAGRRAPFEALQPLYGL
jgi:glycerol-3-phosphate dehydrogenase (NAD(P)+)